LRVMSLERAGYRNAGLIGAANYETAELRHFMGKSSLAGPAERKPGPKSDSHDTLGLFGTS
jgi:hypothetical protein